MNKNKNFLDQLDGGWEDIIANTYKESTLEKILEFPLMKRQSKFFNVFVPSILSPQYEGKRILDIIITENENINFTVEKSETPFYYLYNINYNNVPLKEVIFVLEDGIELKPSTPEVADKEVSFNVMIIDPKDHKKQDNIYIGELSYKISMCEEPVYDLFVVQNATKYTLVPKNLIDLTSDYNQQPNFGILIKKELKEKGLNI